MKHILSLGAGVQSSTMALMAAKGEITPMPDCAIFADTGWEPKRVYEWLDWLETQLPFPLYRVSKGNLREDIVNSFGKKRVASVPFYTESENTRGGLLRRQCTREYKVEPITKKIRELMGLKPRQRAKGKVSVNLWIGISTDEIIRMKPNRETWITNRWPLIEKHMSREKCLDWMMKNCYPKPEKSSCIGCPYHNNAAWREMKMYDKTSWLDAVEIDKLIRNGIRGTKEKLYMHRSLRPLDEVDFRNLEDMGQMNMFNEDCEGLCGV